MMLLKTQKHLMSRHSSFLTNMAILSPHGRQPVGHSSPEDRDVTISIMPGAGAVRAGAHRRSRYLVRRSCVQFPTESQLISRKLMSLLPSNMDLILRKIDIIEEASSTSSKDAPLRSILIICMARPFS